MESREHSSLGTPLFQVAGCNGRAQKAAPTEGGGQFMERASKESFRKSIKPAKQAPQNVEAR